MAERGSSRALLIGGLIVIALAAAIGFALAGRRTPPLSPPPPPPTRPPATLAASPEAPATPAATASATPRAARPTRETAPNAEVVAMVKGADAAFEAGRYDEAATLFEQAARLDPRNAAAGANAISVRRQFVIGATRSENARGGAAAAPGFDASAVAVKRAPENPASIEIVVSPKRVKVGDPYQMEIYLINEGSKAVKVDTIRALHRDAGRRLGGVLPLVVAEQVAPRQRELVAAIKETCGSERDWSLDIAVTAKNGDLYRASVTWK